MKTDEELKAEFLAKRGATVIKPYDARPKRGFYNNICAGAVDAVKRMNDVVAKRDTVKT